MPSTAPPVQVTQVRSQQELAAAVGVSRKTVSRALTGHPDVDDQTRTRIQKMARQLGYRPSAAARVMRGVKNRHVGVVVRNYPADRMTHLLAFEGILGMNEGLQSAGYVLSIVRIGDIEQRLEQSSRVFEESMLDGMILCCELTEKVERHIEQLVPNTVFCESLRWADTRCLRRNEYHAGRLAAQTLIDLGYREIVWLTQPGPRRDAGGQAIPPAYSGVERERGVFEVLAQHHEVAVRQFTLVYDSPDTFQHTPDFIRSLRPDVGVIAPSAYQARWIAKAAASLGLNPPYDFGLVTCDDGYDIQTMWPGLSRASFDRFGMGLAAAEMLINVIDEPAKPVPSRVLDVHWRPGNTAWGPDPIRPSIIADRNPPART